MASQLSLSGKNALVTGGNGGIGEAIALEFARAGAGVAINYNSHPDFAARVVGQIEREGVSALAVAADVTNPEAVAAMFDEVDRRLGRLDILVNNAGIDGPRAEAWASDFDDWQRVIAVNLFGPYLCSREALRRMVPRRSGTIVSITSVHEVIPWSGYSAYTASKAGLGMMMKTLAQEAAEYGVRVFSVAPGAIKTHINQAVWKDPVARSDLNEKIPVHRMGRPDEIGRLVTALVGDAGSYVTGTTVFADGGMTLYPLFEHGG